MTSYTVHHPASSPPEILQRSVETEFVKDGFCWPALFVPLLWLIYRRLWLCLAVYFAFVVMLGVIGDALALADYLVTTVAAGGNLLLALEGNNLRRWTLRRQNVFDVAIVVARSLDHAERRYFHALIDHVAQHRKAGQDSRTASLQPIRMAGPTGDFTDSAGFFPGPGARA